MWRGGRRTRQKAAPAEERTEGVGRASTEGAGRMGRADRPSRCPSRRQADLPVWAHAPHSHPERTRHTLQPGSRTALIRRPRPAAVTSESRRAPLLFTRYAIAVAIHLGAGTVLEKNLASHTRSSGSNACGHHNAHSDSPAPPAGSMTWQVAQDVPGGIPDRMWSRTQCRCRAQSRRRPGIGRLSLSLSLSLGLGRHLLPVVSVSGDQQGQHQTKAVPSAPPGRWPGLCPGWRGRGLVCGRDGSLVTFTAGLPALRPAPTP